MKKNTPAQKTIRNLNRLELYLSHPGHPTQAQMSAHMGLSAGAIQNLLSHLERDGRIQRSGRGRAITILATGGPSRITVTKESE